MMRVLDLFSGIGGFSLGLERAGMKTVAFCEIDPFCRRVLAKHWPEVPCYDDVRELTAGTLSGDGVGPVDVICGGFPCHDISFAGDRGGMEGERSGLWSEYARLVRELRPQFVIVENVAGLLSLGLGDVLKDLAAVGYDAEWHCIPASALGAPHRRDRLWIIAYAQREQLREQPGRGDGTRRPGAVLPKIDDVDANGQSKFGGAIYAEMARRKSLPGDGSTLWERQVGTIQAHAMADGLPDDLDGGLRALGNSVLPQIPELIGRAICEIEQST
jgi:DNA (cytosine-5)-methyltransferase 1